jgi:hypothetical protein
VLRAEYGKRQGMNKEQRQGDFLSKAKDADQKAAKVTTRQERAAWAKIAEGYRHLAEKT